MIEQPLLGSKLLALRTQKGMTQHELREISHVSVRTIQRIESGAVTPRVSTTKILIEALGEDSKEWFDSSNVIVENHFSIKTLKKMLLANASETEQKNALMPAWIAGIVYLLIIIIEQGLDAFVTDINSSSVLLASRAIVKVLAVGSFFLFIRGFISLSYLFENNLLKIASILSIAIVSIFYLSDVVIIISSQGYPELLGTIRAFLVVPLGAVSIVFGIGLLRLQDGMGRIAKVAGRLELAFGISYMTLIFSFVGLLILAPLLVVEIVLLSKADQLAKAGQL